MTELSWKTFALTPLFMYLDGRYPSTNFDAFIDPFYLVALVFWIGVYPSPFLSRIEPAVKQVLTQIGRAQVVQIEDAQPGEVRFSEMIESDVDGLEQTEETDK